MPYIVDQGSSNRRPAPKGNVYRRPDTRVEYQLFSEDYFSNADMHIFFGDIWVDEIVSLNFVLQEEILPIYGYHSYTFNTVARGRRLITGQFTINFKSTGYLQQIVENALPIERAVQQAREEGAIKPGDFKKYKLEDILKLYGKDSFDQIADEYEKVIWGLEEDSKNLLSYRGQPYFKKSSYGFDIKINYGPVSEVYSPSTSTFTTSFKEKPHMTVETINGVQLSGMSKGAGIDSDGQPITETYTFIARDLNGSL